MFNESNTVENYVRDLMLAPVQRGAGLLRETGSTDYTVDDGIVRIASPTIPMGWQYVAGKDLKRRTTEVLVEAELRAALVALNPCIAEKPDHADEVIYCLRAIIQSVNSDGVVKANEQFGLWLRGEKSMPFGPNNQHVSIVLVDFKEPRKNRLVVSTQVTYKAGSIEKRFDLVLWVNGMPLVIGEAKSATRPSVSWVDGAIQISEYEEAVPAFFVPNVFSFATEGKTFRYGCLRMPTNKWAPWREDAEANPATVPVGAIVPTGLMELKKSVEGMLRPEVVIDVLENFTLFATDSKHRKIKLICRYQQYETVNKIVSRVRDNQIKRGLIWHFQGSGKSLLMVFAALKLRRQANLKAPTIIIVVDRIDLDTQITATFGATDVPNVVAVEDRAELRRLLTADTRKVLITTIHKFGEAEGELNARDNIILLVDEAHRTQDGNLAAKMRAALPNAFFFGLTGTPINKRDKNTFYTFGAVEDRGGYMSRYSFEESIRDRATLPLHFEARLVELRIDKAAINEAFRNITGDLTENDAANLSKQAARMGVLVKAPERVTAIATDIVKHFKAKVEPNGYKAMVVVFDQESCVLYKEALDRLLPPEASEVVIRVESGEADERLTKYRRNLEEDEKLQNRFRDPNDPLQILIVTARLLTGFDAPILQTMYLDKPLKEHTLLQAITRCNRTYDIGKTHGLIVDYLGVFDEVARSLAFDEENVQNAITNIEGLKVQLPDAMQCCLQFFVGVDRTIEGYEGLAAAQQCLPNNETRDAFALAYLSFSQLWEALSPDICLADYADDYRWLTAVYDSSRPPSGAGKLIWHALGAKTEELIHQHIHVEKVHDDLETLVMNPDVLEEIMQSDVTKAIRIEIAVSARLRGHEGDPRFVELGQRLEELKYRFEQGMMTSVEWLKLLLAIARDVLEVEKAVEPVVQPDAAKAALTELFYDVKTDKTPVIVERIVADIDDIVRAVRFKGWQTSNKGVREVKQALRSTLRKYQLHLESELFDKAYGYIAQYYAM